MNNNALQITASHTLTELIDAFHDREPEVNHINLSTVDGFNIYSCSRLPTTKENDKIAAVSSSICSLSEAVAKQILNSEFTVTSLETKDGHALFLMTHYDNREAILSISAGSKISLGQIRFLSLKLADTIASL